MRIRARLLAALCVGWVGMSLIAATAHSESESSSDQVIVKFTSESATGQALAQMDLSAIADPAGDARLIQVARDFGERVGIPLLLESLTSGRELLLAVDHQGLAVALAERLRQRDDITAVAMAEPVSDDGAPRLEVEFEPGSAFAELVASGPRVALEPVAGVGEIEVAVQRLYRERAVLALDPDALLGVLLARIKADPEVQYAQPNVRMRPYRAEAREEG
jgi:hypothetical protein